ncbi:MAG: hypothetical protein WCX48_10505 [Bacteroidales bacterium]
MKKIFSLTIFLILIISCNNGGSKTVNILGVDCKTIPGLTAVDVHGNFTNKGFSLEKRLETEVSTWTCKLSNLESEFIVVATGKDPDNIVNVQGTVLNYSDKNTSEIAKDFLGFIASLPYENSQPEVARDWVLNNIEKGGSTSIGNVKFEIIANGDKNRILNMDGI